MKTNDKLTPELRKIEEEIDNYYKSNPLLKLPFATAAWHLLVFAEQDVMKKKKEQVAGTQDLHTLGSDYLVDLEHSMSWLYRSCKAGGQVPSIYDHGLYKASWILFELGKKYDWFVFAYTCASNCVLSLGIEGSTIQPTGDFFTGIEYEAYNILIDPHDSEEALSSVNVDHFPSEVILNSLKIEGDRFHYKLNSRIVSDTVTYLKPLFNGMFSLPSEWRFSRYSLRDFRKVFEIICAVAHIHWAARLAATNQGYMGYVDNIHVRSFDDLLKQVVRDSGVLDSKVRNILDDLTYGNQGISNPEPALQPLIKLNSRLCAIVPHLWICSPAERNFAALLNKLPSEKRIYSELVDEREKLMRGLFTTRLSAKDFRFMWGNIRALTDIDLAIIRDSEKACLLLELKWFIAPALARERIEKSKELAKGICQVKKLKRAFVNSSKLLLEKLEIDTNYRLDGAVVSQNWIGYANVQSEEIPVIRAKHLIEKLKATESLESTMNWLKARDYLPKEGEHFEIRRPSTTIGQWTVKWYGIRSLISDAFFPL